MKSNDVGDVFLKTGTGKASEIAALLEQRIAAGDYPAGSKLPSERELAASFHVSRNTIRDIIAFHIASLSTPPTFPHWAEPIESITRLVQPLDHFGEEFPSPGMLGSIQHIFGRALFDDLPVSHNDNPVSNFSRELDLMGYDDHRRPAFRSEMLHHIKHFDGHLWIEGTSWLIKQGTPEDVLDAPKHPRTREFLAKVV